MVNHKHNVLHKYILPITTLCYSYICFPTVANDSKVLYIHRK